METSLAVHTLFVFDVETHGLLGIMWDVCMCVTSLCFLCSTVNHGVQIHCVLLITAFDILTANSPHLKYTILKVITCYKVV